MTTDAVDHPSAAGPEVALGTYGVWVPENAATPELARQVEGLGFGALWVGGSPAGDLSQVEALLAATDLLAVSTGIVNVWVTPADQAARAYHRIAAAYPGRFLLGIGAGHPEATAEYRKPYDTLVEYFDALDAADVPMAGRVLAALGPRMLALAADRSAGAHPYLTTPAHTRSAREVLGAGPLLAPEQKVVLDTDAQAARALGRGTVGFYLGLRNYVANLHRHGFTEADTAGEASDALVDALAIHGDVDAVVAGLRAHVDAGADHVCVQLLTGDGVDPVPGLRTIAGGLGLG